LAHQAEVATLPDQAVLVHADYNGKNLLMQSTHEGWQVAAVLDWEFAFAGSPLFDTGNFLRHEADSRLTTRWSLSVATVLRAAHCPQTGGGWRNCSICSTCASS